MCFLSLSLLIMQSDQQRPWTLYVHAKFKNLSFKLKAKRVVLPNSNFYQFAFLLKTYQLLIKLESRPRFSFLKKSKSLKSKFLWILEKLRIKPTKKRAISRKSSFTGRFGFFGHEVPNWGNLALLYQSIAEKEHKGIIIQCSIIFFYLISQLKDFMGRNKFILLVILSVAMMGLLGCGLVARMIKSFYL